ncbi:MAG: hypothetical protein JNK05_11235 [Myxococcales bacterium]|nr:hypothetical protein [Myxococcales bacterium]
MRRPRTIFEELALVAFAALVLALVVRGVSSVVIARRSPTRVEQPRVARAGVGAPVSSRRASRAVEPAPAPSLPEIPPPRAVVARAPVRAATPGRARAAQRERWVDLRPRLAERADGTLRLDLRGLSTFTDYRPFAQGVRARRTTEGGYELTSLDTQGYLAAAGIRVGDRLVSINGRPTRSPDELLAAYAMTRFSSSVSLRFARGAEHYAVDAVLVRDATGP